MNDAEFIQHATAIVEMIRTQNWKNGGVHTLDQDEAVELVMQLMRVAYSKGSLDGTREMGECASAAISKAIPK